MLQLIDEDERDSRTQNESTPSVMKNKATASANKMDTSTEGSYEDEKTLDWLRDCFKDLLTANS